MSPAAGKRKKEGRVRHNHAEYLATKCSLRRISCSLFAAWSKLVLSRVLNQHLPVGRL
jgi:hypothetical protein